MQKDASVDVYSVSGVTAYIRDVLDMDAVLHDIWITGEVSNLRKAASGHWYFTLKDADAGLKVVMFRYAASKQRIQPEDGMSLKVRGRIGVYEARGEYQLYAEKLEGTGISGDLYAQFEALKAKLQDEGLFDPLFKKAIPDYPRQIAVVTSPDAAAFRDIQNVLKRRYALAEVILSPTLVQGDQAAGQIVRAIQRVNQQTQVDVILLCRGGGSIEDLWSFNDEAVARAVADSRIPVISGVGHETDFTIVDFVADVRAPTPSAAAELATPDGIELRDNLQRYDTDMLREMRRILNEQTAELSMMQRTLQHVSPARYVQDSLQRVDDLTERLQSQQKRYLALMQERLAAKAAALETLSPQAVLGRGYAMVTRSADGAAVTQDSDVKTGTGIRIQLKDGDILARVEDEETHGQYKRTLF